MFSTRAASNIRVDEGYEEAMHDDLPLLVLPSCFLMNMLAYLL